MIKFPTLIPRPTHFLIKKLSKNLGLYASMYCNANALHVVFVNKLGRGIVPPLLNSLSVLIFLYTINCTDNEAYLLIRIMIPLPPCTDNETLM